MSTEDRKPYCVGSTSPQAFRRPGYCPAALVTFGLSLLGMASSHAGGAAVSLPPTSTSIERELDREAKLELQKKIERELKENQRRILIERKSNSSRTGTENSTPAEGYEEVNPELTPRQ